MRVVRAHEGDKAGGVEIAKGADAGGRAAIEDSVRRRDRAVERQGREG